jgi:hypothetical protein
VPSVRLGPFVVDLGGLVGMHLPLVFERNGLEVLDYTHSKEQLVHPLRHRSEMGISCLSSMHSLEDSPQLVVEVEVDLDIEGPLRREGSHHGQRQSQTLSDHSCMEDRRQQRQQQRPQQQRSAVATGLAVLVNRVAFDFALRREDMHL